MKNTLLIVTLFASTVAGVTGCRGETSREAPIVPIRNMYHQPKYLMQEETEFFPDHRAMRSSVEGTVSREMTVDPEVGQGRLDDGSGYVMTIPKSVVDDFGGMDALLDRGQKRYGIYCTPCHDGTGSGQGAVPRRAQVPALNPPTFHQKRIREIPDGQLFATITNGIRNMPAYGPQIPVADRWAIVGYVRALEISQAPIAGEEKKP